MDATMILQTIQDRPYEHSVIVTGCGGDSELLEIMDAVSEVKDIKHTFKAGIKVLPGVDC
ncbi:Cob(I)yrinic acid a,c-diamide adenosyltransferase [Thalassocella blandensis]|nr:Cob(I)yrinic acid a,c-diamide adenosyltransferase [Thalassocella blandensis]